MQAATWGPPQNEEARAGKAQASGSTNKEHWASRRLAEVQRLANPFLNPEHYMEHAGEHRRLRKILEDHRKSKRLSSEGQRPLTPSEVTRFKFQLDSESVNCPPMRWLVAGLLPRAELGIVYGPSGSGKSFFLYDLLASVARGIAWRGRNVAPAKVRWIAAEGAGGFRNRKLAYAKQNGDTFPGIFDCTDIPDLLGPRDYLQIAEQIKATGGAEVIVIDTLAAATAGANENSGEDMGAVMGHCRQLHKLTGALVLLVHHSGKDSTKGARGWSGLRAAVDVEIEIESRGENRTATVTKLKDGEDGSQFAFRLAPVELGTDEDGNAIRSCVVEYMDTPIADTTRREPKGTIQRLVWDTAQELAGVDTSPLSIEAILTAVIDRMVRTPGKRDLRRQHAAQALQAMANSGLVTIQGDLCTLTH